MGKTCVDCEQDLLDMCYKTCLFSLYYMGVYFKFILLSKILVGHMPLKNIAKNIFFINNIFSSYKMLYSYNYYKKICFSRTINFLLSTKSFLLSKTLYLILR